MLIPLLLGASTLAFAQDAPPPPLQDSAQAPPAPTYSQAQLEQLLAPIALYSDPLVAQILMAATYPLEVVEADRWLQDPQNAALQGDQLASALAQQPWDPSVKSLVPFPQILKMMDSNLQWTEQLGDAFLAEQPAMMDAVQQLRRRALDSGALQSTPQQTVSQQDQEIIIEPAETQTVFVPYYDPLLVFGPWPYPDYPPFAFPMPYGYGYEADLISFGIGIAIVAPLWGWDHWDWHHHRIDIDDNRYGRLNNGHPPPYSGQWHHDPDHRHGIPYRSPETRARFGSAAEQSRFRYRGYGVGASGERAVIPGHAPEARERPSSTSRPTIEAPAEHPSAPLYESFSHGADARTNGLRGAFSRGGGHSRGAGAAGGPHSGRGR